MPLRSARSLLWMLCASSPFVALNACGDSSFGNDLSDAATSAQDASSDSPSDDSSKISDGNAIAVDAGPRCDPAKPFGTPTVFEYGGRVPGGSNDLSATLSADELTLYMTSNRTATTGPDALIYVATRTTTNDSFGMLSPLAGVTSFPYQQNGTATADGLRFYFTAQQDAPFLIYLATRSSLSTSFSGAAAVNGFNTAGNLNYAPWVMPDGKTLYFTSDRSGNGDLFFAALNSDGTPSNITPLTELNDSALDQNPVVSPDGRKIYFNSLRAPHADGEIYQATRASTSAQFGNIALVSELNSTSDDIPDWVSADDCRVLLASLRFDTDGAIGNYVLFQAERPK